jgi:S1-C subfamily serine protease
MSEHESDQPSEPSAHEHDTPPIPMPGIAGAAIPLPPPVGAPGPETLHVPDPGPGETLHVPHPGPEPGVTPPAGTPVGPTAVPPGGMPYGSYALGALDGNPQLGGPSGSGYGGPPTNPGFSSWGAPPTNPGFSSWGAPPPPSAPRGSGPRGRLAAVLGGAAVLALAAGVGIGHVAWTSNTSSPTAAPASGSAPSSNGSGFSGSGSGSGSRSSGSSGSSGPGDVSAIANKVDPGLVDINTTLGFQQEEAAGTGIVLTSNGEILTNNHVINGATTISVTDVGNGNTYSASVVGYSRTKDIAVLQLHSASGLTTATIGDSSKVSVGQDVVGIGNAGGTGGTPSAAGGTVTALNQSITASDEGDGSSEQLTGLIETNADIQAGDSGGSLVNTAGEVVGIDTAASAGFSFQSSGQSAGNQGYAIPINAAIAIAKQIEAGTASSTVHIGATAFLGVEIAQTTCSSGGSSGVGGGNFGFGSGGFGNGSGSGSGSGSGGGSGNTASSGALICSVVTSSPAQEGGLAEGDTITSLNSQAVASPTALTNLLEPFHPGNKVTIGWSDSSGQSHSASVTLSSGPPQ